jgi:serine phosphatase RsbU (regulator of sigma subunit)
VRHLDGTVSVVGEPGPLLGIWLQHETCRTTRLVLRHGELLVAYSDGATDHRGPEGTFGEARLIAAVESTAGGRAKRSPRPVRRCWRSTTTRLATTPRVILYDFM